MYQVTYNLNKVKGLYFEMIFTLNEIVNRPPEAVGVNIGNEGILQ